VRYLPEPKPGEDDPGAPVGVPGRVVLRAVEPLAVLAEKAGVGRRVRSDVGQRPGEPVEFGEVLAGFAQGVVEHVLNRRRGIEGHLLVQEAEVRRPDDGAGVRLVCPGEQPHQGRLTDTVLTDEPDPVPGGSGQRDAVEHSPRTERTDEIMGEQS
jgi:hypothetical protein